MSSTPSTPTKAVSTGTIGWGKLGRYPHWPCMIVEPNSAETVVTESPSSTQRKGLCARFFGTHDYAWISESNFLPFEENLERLQKCARSPAFKVGVQEASECLKSSSFPYVWLEAQSTSDGTMSSPPPQKKRKSATGPKPSPSSDPKVKEEEDPQKKERKKKLAKQKPDMEGASDGTPTAPKRCGRPRKIVDPATQDGSATTPVKSTTLSLTPRKKAEIDARMSRPEYQRRLKVLKKLGFVDPRATTLRLR
eukprot:TRINITY_DN11552_c0_g1_i1.p1 TRINITY_DN11552_c0_g1~~TRINITY_DN11552_c0_g1_i1.p1  ORF type:complete len:251 (+),score=51.27 TRINITY_DN11552_c0_g1_i1:49-801(+)